MCPLAAPPPPKSTTILGISIGRRYDMTNQAVVEVNPCNCLLTTTLPLIRSSLLLP